MSENADHFFTTRRKSKHVNRRDDFLALTEKINGEDASLSVDRELTYLRRRVEEMAKEIKRHEHGARRREEGEHDSTAAVSHIRKQTEDIGKLLRENQVLRLRLDSLEGQLDAARVSETDQREIALRSESTVVNLQAQLRISENRLDASVRREITLKSVVGDLQQKCEALASRLDRFETRDGAEGESKQSSSYSLASSGRLAQLEKEIEGLRTANREMMEVHAVEVRQYETRLEASEEARRRMEWEKVEVERVNADLDARLRADETRARDDAKEIEKLREALADERDVCKEMVAENARKAMELKTRTSAVTTSQVTSAMKTLARALPELEALVRVAEIRFVGENATRKKRKDRNSASLSVLLSVEEEEGGSSADSSRLDNQVRLADRLLALSGRARRVRASVMDRMASYVEMDEEEEEEEEEDDDHDHDKCVVS